ncbi:MAG: penicillin-binding protein 2 [Alphaproteobacteria bacterium]|nr:penicillin-binding protein 2 [Alphaproteobacteria bacterium]
MRDFLNISSRLSGRHGKDIKDNAAFHASSLLRAKARLVMVVTVFMVGYLAISLRLADLTLLRAKPAEDTGLPQDVRPLKKPLRGPIVDRNGNLVATSLAMASVYADTTMIENAPAVARELAAILPDEKEPEILRKLQSGKKFIWIARDITPRQEYKINALGHPGLAFQEEERRIYPEGNLLAHLLGYTDVDGNGIAGIEKAHDADLKAGDKTVRLTIDLRVQHIMHRELSAAMKKFSAKAGVGLVMDVDTGDVISMVSLPDFDPLHPGDARDAAMFPRATLGVYEMGSTFKLFSMAAALDSGRVHFSSEFDATKPLHYGRFTINDYEPKHRFLTVPEIFIYSSNIGTAKMAEYIGTDALKSFYRRMGFFDTVPVDLPERGAPLYPRPWRDINTLTAAFGHGVAVSPLHLVRAAAALVNGGIMIKPHLVQTDEPRRLSPGPEGERVIKPQTSLAVRRLLEMVVAAGTGRKAYVEGYDVGGKTGTAEKNKGGKYEKHLLVSSFLGVYPISNPRYVVLAMLDEPHGTKDTWGFATGGWVAAPVVAKVVEQMAPLYHIPPDFNSHDIVREMAMYLKDAKEGKSLASVGTDR